MPRSTESSNKALASLQAELASLRAEVAELRPLAQEELARQRLRSLFISALVCTAQNGFAAEVDPFVGLCRETWGEEALFDALKDHPHANGRTRLMYAARVGDAARVGWLLKRGAKLELADGDGYTALFFACMRGDSNFDAVAVLLDAGANPNATCGGKSSPLHLIVLGNGINVVRALLSKGADIEARYISLGDITPLHMAALHNKTEVVCELLERGADIHAVCRYKSSTPLHLACAHAADGTVRALLDKGADTEVVDDQGCTPLRRAALSNNCAEVVVSVH